jgi:outer membrane cobalamin receptor
VAFPAAVSRPSRRKHKVTEIIGKTFATRRQVRRPADENHAIHWSLGLDGDGDSKKEMKRLGILVWACGLAVTGLAQSKLDSVQHVREIVVVSRPAMREVVPSQKLNGELLEKLNTHSVADALRYFSGIQLKDYGGVGGIKTVNIRSMGTHHLGISYDGVQLGNAQNGQIDLGQFSLDNVEEITLYNGQKSAIFQPASDFGNAGAIYIRTKAPDLSTVTSRLRFKAQYGSSDMLRLSALWEQKLSETVSSSVSAGFLTASGKYKFHYERRYPNGEIAWDTTAVRQNGDIHAERIEANVFGRLDQGSWQLKGYLYNSARGIPGAIVNNVWRRGERQQDLNTFFQAAFDKSIGEGFSTRWLAKYAYYNTHYENKDITQLPVDNRYKQQELYLSTANVLELLPNWSASLSYDFKWNKLDADLYNFAYPTRISNLVSLATAIDYKHLKAQGSILATFINDRSHRSSNSSIYTLHSSLSKLTPALFLNLYPFHGTFFSMRAYVKKSFRMPTFNDLYYTDMGNANLIPESALQYDLGFVLNKHFEQGIVRHAEMHFDAYYNTVHDKIVAYPKGQQFRWTMLNLGKVHIKGIDIEAEADFQISQDLVATARAQYTYQDARDVTDSSDSYYNDQIPYIPWHSGSAIVGLSYKNWDLNYSFIYAGERYDEQENILYNHMEPWYTSDLSLRYWWKVKSGRWRENGLRMIAQLEVNNVLDQDYEAIVNYPMPGRNYALTLSMEI